jgi:crossover junction endodeoxyribonuclease RuvC
MALSCVLGIDPGAQGAIAIFGGDGELLGIKDMPITEEANGRKATNPALLASLIAETRCDLIFCEGIHARPTDGSIQAFAFGRVRGVIEGIAAAYDLQVVFIQPQTWKRFAQVPPGKAHKDVARTRAISRWPAHCDLFGRKRDVDRAEAAFIGAAGLHRHADEITGGRPRGVGRGQSD